MRSILSLLFLLTSFSLLWHPLSGQEEDPNDPTRRLPDGVKRSTHTHYAPDGAKVDQARICPPSWWVGMENSRLELMIYDQDIANLKAEVDHKGVKVIATKRLANPNYLFVELEIAPECEAGSFEIRLKHKRYTQRKYSYELAKKGTRKNKVETLNAQDFIYLIMPDRFANGDPSNDVFDEMTQKEIRRDLMFFRHGGDLQGIIDHLDYIQSLGVTALWLNPVLENDQPYESYHGYAMTDHYAIDRRFGSNELFKELSDACQERGIKMIMDIIHNHVGDQHWFIQDIPSEDWLHQYESFTKTTYRAPTLMDPYASEADKALMSDGWFDHHMPDLNQKNPHLATYLIQNNIWWIEYAGLDGYRIDTYAYPDQAFMQDWAKAIQREYPDFHMFAETWVHGAAVQAQFTQNNQLRGDYNSHMPGVTDFQLYYAINEALQKPQGWTEGAAKIYYTLAKDFLYEDPYRNVVFLDNHDLSRFFAMVGEDDRKFKSGIAFLLTTRGIPMMYYGTELQFNNFSDPDGKVRQDFPGGWAEDTVNKFEAAGRSKQEQSAFDYVSSLANYRKNSKALTTGKLTQFVPQDGIYVYFRSSDDERIMVVMNTADEEKKLKLDRFKEGIQKASAAKDIVSGEKFDLNDDLTLPPFTTFVLKLQD